MNDLKKLTRIILVGLAVYVLARIGFALVVSVAYMITGVYSDLPISIGGIIVSISLWLFFSGLIVYLLIYKSNFWSEKIVGSVQVEKPEAEVFWVPVSFRLVSIFSGILYVFFIISRMISKIGPYIAYYISSHGERVMDLNFYQFLSWIIFLVFGIYLIFGAPHFVRWQVKKTMEQFKGSSETELQQDG